jgi:hypothetical protein
MPMSDLSGPMRRVIHYYSPDTDDEAPHPTRRRGEGNRDRAFLNDVLATAWDAAVEAAYKRGYEAALRERGLMSGDQG